MQHRSSRHRRSQGSSRPVVSVGASRRTSRSCSGRESTGASETFSDMSKAAGTPGMTRKQETLLTIDVLTNQRELHIESNNVNASCIRFWQRDKQSAIWEKDTGGLDDVRRSHPRTTSDRTRSVIPGTPTPLRSRNSESTSFVPTVDHQHQRACTSTRQL